MLIPIEGGGGSPSAIAAGDVNRDGHPDLVIANRGSGDVTLLLGDGTRHFRRAPSSPIPVGTGPSAVGLGDVNGDGWLDIVTSNLGSHTITVMLGGPGGVFTPAGSSPFHAGPSQLPFLALGDVSGDGKPDLVAADWNGVIGIFAGDGTGSFTRTSGPALPLPSPVSSFALGDVNGDGRLDLVATTQPDFQSGRVTITTLIGMGPLTFQEAPGSPTISALPADALALGDVDRDGHLDLVISDTYGQRLAVLRGDGRGGFQVVSQSNSASRSDPVSAGGATDSTRSLSSIALLDANHDGVLDLAAVDDVAWTASVWLGNVSGGFIEPSEPPITLGADAEAVATSDLDGDGRLDLVTANVSNRTVSILRQDASGRFYPMAGSPISVAIEPDFLVPGPEVDGRTRELLIRDWYGSVSVLLADETGTFAPAAPSPSGLYAYAPSTADIDGDGWLDLVTQSETLDVLFGSPDGSFHAAEPSPVALQDPVLLLGDVTGDRRPDLVTGDEHSPGAMKILRGDGHGGFSPMVGSPFALGLLGVVAAGDVNGDGAPDLVTLGYTRLEPYVYGWATAILLGDGRGGFARPTGTRFPVTLPDRSDVQEITASDVNGDGRLDLVLVGNGNNVLVLIGDGLGRFTLSAGSPVFSGDFRGSGSVSVSDLDGDGRPDLAIADGSASRVALLRNGSVTPASVTASAGTPQQIAVLSPLVTPLSALVRDAAGFPVPDVVVTFSAPGSGASGSFPSGAVAVTNALGVASVPFTANQTTGTYDVTASLTPFQTAPARFRLTNSEVSIQAAPATVSRGASSRSTIAFIAGRRPDPLSVTTTLVPPGITVTDLVRSDLRITATISATCDVPLGPSIVALRVSDGVYNATSDLVVEVTRDATPPRVTPPSPVQVLLNQSTCEGGGGASLASLAAHYPLQAQALRSLVETESLTAFDDCTAIPTRLTPQKVVPPTSNLGVDITETTLFPVGTSLVRFHFRDDEGNEGSAYGVVNVLRNGDLDSLEGVTIFDLVTLASYLVGNVDTGSRPFLAPAADVNADGAVDVFDLLLIASYIVGNVDCLAP